MLTEKEIEEIEEEFIRISSSAFKKAFDNALALGLSVMVSEGGEIYEIHPNGDRKFIKNIEPPTRVEIGTKIIF